MAGGGANEAGRSEREFAEDLRRIGADRVADLHDGRAAVWERIGAAEEALGSLKETLPPGSWFEFAVTGEHLRLEDLKIPRGHRGVGTEFLARVLAVADRHGLPTLFATQETDEPGEPSPFEQARWCARFGFFMNGVDDDGIVTMRRQPSPFRGGHEPILESYAAAKRTCDMTPEWFERLRDRFEAQRDCGGPKF